MSRAKAETWLAFGIATAAGSAIGLAGREQGGFTFWLCAAELFLSGWLIRAELGHLSRDALTRQISVAEARRLLDEMERGQTGKDTTP